MRFSATWRPMVPWIIAAFLCAPLAVSLFIFSRPVEPGDRTPEIVKNMALVARDFARPLEGTGARRGVVFAISGLACAIAGPRPLPGGGIKLTVLMKSAGSLLDFGPLVEPTIGVRPDFVVMQSTMLVSQGANFQPNAIEVARSFWRGQVLSWLPGPIPLDWVRQEAIQEPTRTTLFTRCRKRKNSPQEQWEDDLDRVTARIMPPEDSRREEVRAILRRFVEAGIPVLVVTPPFNKVSEAYYAKVRAAVQSTVGPIKGAAQVFVREPPDLWPNEQFGDALHLDVKQNEPYQAWLAASIATALAD